MKPQPLSNMHITGPGVDIRPEDPFAGMPPEARTAYFVESLLYHTQTQSPHSKGVYFLLAYSPLALLGLHKFYLGKCLHGLLIQLLSVTLGLISGGILLPLAAIAILICVCMETYRDSTGRKPLTDAAGRQLQ